MYKPVKILLIQMVLPLLVVGCGHAKDQGKDLNQMSRKQSADSCVRFDDGKSSVRWDSNTMLVGVNLIYANVCKRPVQCKLRVATGNIESNSDPKMFQGWVESELQTVEFELPPAKQIPVEGGIPWRAEKGRTPVLRFPQPPSLDMEFLHCSYAK